METERIIWEGKPSWKNYVISLAASGLILLPSILALPVELLLGEKDTTLFVSNIVIGGFVLGLIALHRFQYDFKVTSQRIIVTKGLIARKMGELDIKDIRSINISQGILQRLLGLGNLEFTSAAGPVKEVKIVGIKNHHWLKEEIRKYKTP
jgi:uncharacterized membrane protein YdbT with pleckstrin-like domain